MYTFFHLPNIHAHDIISSTLNCYTLSNKDGLCAIIFRHRSFLMFNGSSKNRHVTGTLRNNQKKYKKSSCVGPKNSVLTSWKVHRSDIYIIYFIDLVVLKVWHTNISLLKLIVLNLVKHNNWTNMALVSSWQKWPWIWLYFYTNSHKACTFSICKG